MTGTGTKSRRARTLAPTVEGLLVAGVSVVCVAWALRLWHADLAVPLRYTAADDAKFYLMLVKGLVEHGSYLSNPSLGAPFGQHLYDLPQGADNLNLLILRGLTLFTSNLALVVNLFLLLSFSLAALGSHVVLRALGISAPVAGVISVLFSLLTYHFFRGESHCFCRPTTRCRWRPICSLGCSIPRRCSRGELLSRTSAKPPGYRSGRSRRSDRAW